MNQIQTKNNVTDSTIELIELHPQELQLIKMIRKSLRFGEIVILVRDGLPYRLKRITELVNLNYDEGKQDVS